MVVATTEDGNRIGLTDQECFGVVRQTTVIACTISNRCERMAGQSDIWMAVAVEVNADNRRIVEFFLSPLLRYQDKSIRER